LGETPYVNVGAQWREATRTVSQSVPQRASEATVQPDLPEMKEWKRVRDEPTKSAPKASS